jgi:hypothetical protein
MDSEQYIRVWDAGTALKSSLGLLQYPPLDSTRREIRLLEIQPGKDGHISCRLYHAPLDDSPTYNCLSYTWGNPENPGIIEINNSYIEVTKNLFSALIAIRHTNEKRTFWIDAVCINQADLEERASQVRQMRRIYSLADDTVVWIQESGPWEIKAIELFLEILSVWPRDTPWPEPDIETSDGKMWVSKLEELFQTPCLIHLFQATWWRRVWTLQELVVAKRVSVWCGPMRISWDDLAWCIEACGDAYEGLSHDPYNGVTFDFYIMNRLRKKHQEGKHEPLIKLLVGTQRLATNPRDKIFALLGICDTPDGVEIDYISSTNQVFESAARFSISQGFADLVFTAVQPSFESTLPSWVPDWQTQRQNVPYWGYSCATTLDWDVSGPSTPGLFTAKGLHFGTIEDMGIVADAPPIPHLAVLRDWENVVLRKFTDDTATIAPYSAEFRERARHYRQCDEPLSCRCFDEPEPNMSVSDILRHWQTRFVTVKRSWPPGAGPQSGRSQYQRQGKGLDEDQAIPQREVITDSLQDENDKARVGYPTGSTVTEAYFRTLFSDKIDATSGDDQLLSDWMAVFTLSNIPEWDESFGKPYPREWNRLRSCIWNDILNAALQKSISNRRLVILSNNYIGLAPATTQIGDVVCVFSGAMCPMVLRRAGNTYKFVGTCYVHGIMDGELFSEGRLFDKSALEDISIS